MKNDETKKYHPTEELVASARMALRTESDFFWNEVLKELDKLEPEVEPRRLRD